MSSGVHKITRLCIDERRLRGLFSLHPDRQPRCGSDSARTHRPVPLHPQVTFPICPDPAPTSAISAPATADPAAAAPSAAAIDAPRHRIRRAAGARGRPRAQRPRDHRPPRDERHRAPRRSARDLELDTATGERKDDLVDQILQRQTERAGHDYATGILDIVDEGFGFMRRHGLLPSPEDVYVSSSQVRRFGLRIGDRVSGAVRAPREAEKYWGMLRVDSRQRRRHRHRPPPPGLRRPDPGPPGRPDQPRDRSRRT